MTKMIHRRSRGNEGAGRQFSDIPPRRPRHKSRPYYKNCYQSSVSANLTSKTTFATQMTAMARLHIIRERGKEEGRMKGRAGKGRGGGRSNKARRSIILPMFHPSRRRRTRGGAWASPSYIRRYSSTIIVPSITQLCWGSGQTMIDEIFILKRMK